VAEASAGPAANAREEREVTAAISAVTVAVVTFNSEDCISGLLDSLPAAFGHVPYETVVVDNGSVDSTLSLLDGRHDCTVVRSSNVGYAAGVNCAVRQDEGRGPILVLNPDVVMTPGSVSAMLKMLEAPRAGIVAPLTREVDGSLACQPSPSASRVRPSTSRRAWSTGLSVRFCW
jgi:GT2 family glycosyltransferase